MSNTGAGLEGIKYSTFQEYIVKDVCKYYFDLDPVLKNRPNVSPWYVGESKKRSKEQKEKEKQNEICLSSDDDSDESFTFGTNESRHDLETPVADSDIQKDRRSNFEYESSTSMISTTTSSSNKNSPSPMNICSDDSKSISNKAKSVGKVKMSPIDAKKKQKKLIKKKRSIVNKTLKGKGANYIRLDEDEQALILETRTMKMKFEVDKHNDMKQIEAKKLKIAEEKLLMEKRSIQMRQDQISFGTNKSRKG